MRWRKWVKGQDFFAKNSFLTVASGKLTARELVGVVGFLMRSKKLKMLAGLCSRGVSGKLRSYCCADWLSSIEGVMMHWNFSLTCSCLKQFWLLVPTGIKIFLEIAVSMASPQFSALLVFSKTVWGFLEASWSFFHSLPQFYQEHAY